MFVMSKTELFCYVIIFFHTALSPTMISLPLPLLVFFWGSLTTIRPTTTFWTVLIAYTEVLFFFKFCILYTRRHFEKYIARDNAFGGGASGFTHTRVEYLLLKG